MRIAPPISARTGSDDRHGINLPAQIARIARSSMVDVVPIAAIPLQALRDLLAAYGLQIQTVAAGAAIPGSYWGEPEAGLIGEVLWLRADTPVHSALHEACHFICMDKDRRQQLHTNAGGTDLEETAVCFLQALLAERLQGYSQAQLFSDMDAWGYHFVLGSAAAWFGSDAEDARNYLLQQGLIDSIGVPVPGRQGKLSIP